MPELARQREILHRVFKRNLGEVSTGRYRGALGGWQFLFWLAFARLARLGEEWSLISRYFFGGHLYIGSKSPRLYINGCSRLRVRTDCFVSLDLLTRFYTCAQALGVALTTHKDATASKLELHPASA